MCIGNKDTNGTGWRFNLPIPVLYIFLMLGSLGSLGADDAQTRIMEKVIALEQTLQELMDKIEGLDRRITALEKGAPAHRETPRVAPPQESAAEKKAKKLIDIGQGFYVLNLGYEGIVENTIFTGELENSGTKDYQFVLLKVEVYDGKGKLLGDNVLNIDGMSVGTTKPFKITIYGVNVRDVANYEIKFVKGF